MQTGFGETRAGRGPPAGSLLGSNTSSTSQLPGLGGAGGAGGSSNNHVPASGLRRRNIFTLGKSDQERIRDLGVEEDDPLPDYHEDPHHAVTMKDVFGGIFHSNEASYMNGESAVDVEHYIHDKSIRRRLILLSLSNSKFGIRMQMVRSFACIIGVLLYLVEVTYQDYRPNKESLDISNKSLSETLLLQLETLVFVKGNYEAIWALQVVIALLQFTYDIIILYVSESWSCLAIMKVIDFPLFVSIIIPLLYFITLIYPPKLKDLFVPAFLYCWPAKQAITAAVIQKLQRKHYAFNSFRLEAVRLFAFLVCFVFTWVCVLHHVFRIDVGNHLTFFETYYLVMVTMSTVGYGDFAPKHWTGRVLITVFIISALIYLIPHLEKLFEAFQMQRKLHNSVNFKQAGPNHILICATQLKPLVLRDFLTEFYSDPDHLDVHTVVLLEQELPSAVQLYLSHPIWSKRITILIGSPLRLADLERARARSAYACFIHSTRDTSDPDAADQHTIMCAWAVRDHNPKCQLYVQILKPENRLHLEVADHIVCEGELKYALVANSCHCPGITTLMSLLLHTFKQEPKMWTSEDHALYTACAPCEIYDTKLKGSIYFHHFVGKNFLYTAVVAFRKYRVTLIGVTPAGSNQIKLNPGIEHTMQEDDTCYYIGFTREEFSRVGGVQSIHHSLQQACATLAAYSMSAVGINPNDLDEKNELEMKGAASNMPSNASSTPTYNPSSRRLSTHSMANQQGPNNVEHSTDGLAEEGSQVRFFIPNQDAVSVDSVSITMQPHIHVNSPGDSLHRDSDKFLAASHTVSEAKRGLQLFRFHSGLDVHANPVVKLRCHSLEVCQETPTGTTGTTSPVHPYTTTHAHPSAEQPLPSYHGSHLHSVVESHHLLPRLSEASEEREGSPYSEDHNDHPGNNDDGDDVISSQSPSQNDVFVTSRADIPFPKQLEEGHYPLPPNIRVQQASLLHKNRGHLLPPLTFQHRETIADMHPSHHHERKSAKGHHHYHPTHHMGYLKPHPPAYHRSLSEGILEGRQQLSAPSTHLPPPYPPTPHKGTGTPLYSSTLSLIVPEDESVNKKITKSLSHEELSPREVTSHHNHGAAANHHHFLDFLRHPGIWNATANSHSNHDIHAHANHEEKDVLELELEDIEEEEELEELEEGHCHDITQDTSDTKTRTSSSMASDEEEVERPKSRKQRVIYEKGPLPISPYYGFETPRCHLVLYQRNREDVAHIYDTNCGDFREELKDHDGLVVVYCEEASDELYHFILPLRAHQLSAKDLKPIVFMLGQEPPVHFVDCLTWLPLVYYTVGKLSKINDWLKAGITLAKTVLILSTLVHMPTALHHEHMIDATQIMAIQRLSRLFPYINFVTEIRYRFNVKYLRFSSVENRMMRNQRDMFRRSDHLFYLFMPQLAAGKVYCSSVLDTLLYQTHKKSYMVDLVRQLVGCKQTPGSGYLWSVPVDKEMLSLQTYDRVFQRLASTHRAVPLGIYRTVPRSVGEEEEDKEDKELKEERYHDGDNIKRFLNARMMSLGLEHVDSTTKKVGGESQSFVLPNPDPKTRLKPNDVILILKCPPPPKHYEPSTHGSFQCQTHPVPVEISQLNLTSTPKSNSSTGKSPQSSESKSTASSSKTCSTIGASRCLFKSKSGYFNNTSSRSMPESNSSTHVPVAEDGTVQGKNCLTVPVECYVTEC